MKKLFLTLSFVLGAGVLAAQDFDSAVRQAQERLERAQQQLEALNEEIAENRPSLAAELDVLEDEVVRLRAEVSDAARIRQSVDLEVSQLQQRLRDIQENNNYIKSTLLNDYFRRFENNIDESQIPLYREKVRRTLELLDTDDPMDDSEIFERQLELLNVAVQRLADSIGGMRFEGEASIARGAIREGTFVVVGPNSYFQSDDGELVGISRGTHNNRADIYLLPQYRAGIARVIETGEGDLPVDTTDGEAWEAEEHTLTLAEEIRTGGPVMVPILTLLFVATIIAIFKAFELFSVKSAKERDLRTILGHIREGDKDKALAHAKSVGGPVGDMLTAAVENSGENKEVVEEILYEKIINTQPKLERFLAIIAVTAATAPLLGLLGTVTGMIRTFKLITIVGTGDARNFAAGISEALITTKWGLMIAIPTLIVHALLNRKAKGVVASMEQTAVGFINGIEEIRLSKKDAA